MLVLTRRTDESVYIDENIRITVIRIENNKVRLGITAPPDVKVLRTELLDKINETSNCHNNGNKPHDFRNRRQQ